MRWHVQYITCLAVGLKRRSGVAWASVPQQSLFFAHVRSSDTKHYGIMIFRLSQLMSVSAAIHNGMKQVAGGGTGAAF